MNKPIPKVFAQAEALWRPESAAMRHEFELRREAVDRQEGSKGGSGSGNRAVAQVGVAKPEIEARGAKILECLLEAHKIAANVRCRAYSVSTFCDWHSARMDEEAADARRNPPMIAGRQATAQHYLEAVADATRLAKDRARARIGQHFATATQTRFTRLVKKLAPLKSVPSAWWLAAVTTLLAILSLFSPSFAETIRSLFGLN